MARLWRLAGRSCSCRSAGKVRCCVSQSVSVSQTQSLSPLGAGRRFIHEANGYTWLVTYLDIKARYTGKVFNLPNTFKDLIEVIGLLCAHALTIMVPCPAHQDPHRGTDSGVLGHPRRGPQADELGVGPL